MNANYLVGLFEGEGCFQIRYTGTQWKTIFSIAMSDHALVRAIHQHLGFGCLDEFKPTANKYSLLRWTCGSIEDCQKLIELLDNHPMRGSKHNEYLAWREAVHIRASKPKYARYSPDQHERLVQLQNRIRRFRIRNQEQVVT